VIGTLSRGDVGLRALVLLIVAGFAAWTLWGRAGIDATAKPVYDERVIGGGEVEQPEITLKIDGPWSGSPTAGIVVVEFSDFQCPYCRAFYRQTMPPLQASYVDTGLVRLTFRHLPLEQIHPFALLAAEYGVCAAKQGRFWEFRDRLLGGPPILSADDVIRSASGSGVQDLESCAASAKRVLLQDRQLADQLNVAGTPTFLLGRALDGERVLFSRRLVGAVSERRFREVLESLLAKVR
jgi:protein-disulfide isomerase